MGPQVGLRVLRLLRLRFFDLGLRIIEEIGFRPSDLETWAKERNTALGGSRLGVSGVGFRA